MGRNALLDSLDSDKAYNSFDVGAIIGKEPGLNGLISRNKNAW